MNMKDLYEDPSFPGSFSGKNRFYKQLRNKGHLVSPKTVANSLKAIDSYTLHKPDKKPGLYRRIWTKGIKYLYQCDLVDLSSLHRYNDGYKWIVTIIDTFSKKAWALKMKNKSANSVVAIMEPFLRQNTPKKMQFDQGTEFYNKKFLRLLKELNIKHYSVYSDKKGAIVERFNRTLKTRMFKYFTSRGTHRWIDVLQDLIDGYNESKHRSIKHAPNDVTSANEILIRKILFPKVKKKKKFTKIRFKVGDSVRITRQKRTFQKGYEQLWSHEVFTISEIKDTYPITYGLKDYKGEEIKGSFYTSEIQIVDKSNSVYQIEKVLDKRTRRGQTEYLVKWQGYPNEANTWVPHFDLFSL